MSYAIHLVFKIKFKKKEKNIFIVDKLKQD